MYYSLVPSSEGSRWKGLVSPMAAGAVIEAFACKSTLSDQRGLDRTVLFW